MSFFPFIFDHDPIRQIKSPPKLNKNNKVKRETIVYFCQNAFDIIIDDD